MKRVEKFLEAGGEIFISGQYADVGLKGNKIFRLPVRYLFSEDIEESNIMEYYLKILINLTTKSPQEIAAEEAVQKAESALKAAKDVLKTVKEK